MTWTLVSSFGSAVRGGEGHLSNVAPLLKQLLDEGAWRSFTPPGKREPVTPRSFAEFLNAKPTEGVGVDYATVRRLLVDDAEARDLLDRAIQRPPGGDHRATNVDNINIGRPDGTSADRALRALRDKAPEVHARVLAGELSPHGGMLAAGLRHPTATVRVDDIDSAMRTLLKHYTPDQIRGAL